MRVNRVLILIILVPLKRLLLFLNGLNLFSTKFTFACTFLFSIKIICVFLWHFFMHEDELWMLLTKLSLSNIIFTPECHRENCTTQGTVNLSVQDHLTG